MIDFTIYRESGAPVAGRGTVVEADDFNMKASADPAVLYYPHDAAANAPLVRPLFAGDVVTSYKVYTFFKVSGTYTKLKNLKLRLTLESPQQASKAMLFYRLTNIYANQTNAFDGQMMPAWNGSAWVNGESSLVLHPSWSLTGPTDATTRNIVYGPNQTIYSSYLVTQLYVAAGPNTGNSAEFKARLECIEFGEW